MYCCNAEATLEIVLVDLLECRGILFTNKRSTVIYTSLWSFNSCTGTFTKFLASHRIWFHPSGLSFQHCAVLAPNLECSVNMLDCYWIALDLVAPNDPFEVLSGWIIELGVQGSCNLHFLDLPLCEACLILGDSITKIKLAVSQIKIMGSALVHPKFHIRLFFWYPGMIACFFTSMVPPLLFSLMLWQDLKVDSIRAGSQIRSIASGLAIQEYNLLEVKFDLGAMSLFEELGNLQFKFDCHLFHLHLRELESIVKLKVQILFF